MPSKQNELLKKILIKEKIVTKDNYLEIVKEARNTNATLIEIILNKGLVTNEQLGKIVARSYETSYLKIRHEKFDDEVFMMVPETFARNKQIIAVNKTDKGIQIGMVNPSDLATKKIIEKRFGQKLNVFYITEFDLDNVLGKYSSTLQENFNILIEKLDQPDLIDDIRDDIIVRLVDLLIHYGHNNKASDIHIEPHKNSVVVRYRIDGVLHDFLKLKKGLHESILTRIKILAKMRTDQHRAAQDGKITFLLDTLTINIRVSVVPVIEGENVVLRILSEHNKKLGLITIGLSETDIKKIRKATKHGRGMILATGPTGSGKTTTLYSVLKELNKREVHISTIEDPVEYDIDGISQIQVNKKNSLTFARGLRSLVRQDPDIIMVGEIRDNDTAKIAVNSAMTGHLLLSSMHTNDAATAIPRFLNMGIEPYLLASTVEVIIAQRLVRRICPICIEGTAITKEDKLIINSNKKLTSIFASVKRKKKSKITLYKGAGCDICSHKGYSGRIGIFEVLPITDEIRDLILQHTSSEKLAKLAIKQGMKTMLEDGMRKVLRGDTTLEELIRVTGE